MKPEDIENIYNIERIVEQKDIIGIIYLTINLVNGKAYSGQQKILNKKIKSINKYKGSGTVFKKALEKYGDSSFEKYYIDIAKTTDELNEKETYWIEYYDLQDRDKGYNIQSGGYRENLHYGVEDSMIWVTDGDENLQILKSKFDSYLKRGFKKGTNLKGKKCIINDGSNEYTIFSHELKTYLDKGFEKGRIKGIPLKPDKIWIQNNNQKPTLVGKDKVDEYLEKGFTIHFNCPICGKENSYENVCCCDEHYEEFNRIRKEKVFLAQSEFTSSTWADEKISNNRKKNISKAYGKRRELREAGELDKYIWVKKESIEHCLQIPESKLDEYLSQGYELGRLGYEDTSNMGRGRGFKWSEESIIKREESRKINYEENMKDPEYAKKIHDRAVLVAQKSSAKKKETWANKEMDDEWRRKRSEETKAGFAAKKAERLARGECVTKKWVNKDGKSMRVLETEYETYLSQGWRPGRGKLKNF